MMDGTRTAFEQIESWMKEYLADLLDIPAEDIDTEQPFEQMGLDSAASVAFTTDLGNWLGIRLETDLMVENDSIDAVAAFIRKSFA